MYKRQTHSDLIIREWCTRVIWLEKGRILADGPVMEIMDEYAVRSTEITG